MGRRSSFVIPALLLSAVACDGAERPRSLDAAPPAATVVDTVRPFEEEMRRFRADIAEVPDRLAGGMASRDALVRDFVRAVERYDTLAFGRMLMTKGEMAYLFYPSNPLSRPPYELDPSLFWFRTLGESDKGLRRLLQRYGGDRLKYVRYDCPEEPEVQGENRLWVPCQVYRVDAAGDTVPIRLFGAIVERDGQFKFVSYANKL